MDLKLQLDSLASELKHLSLLQQHFINTATNFPILSAPSTNNSPTVTTASKSTATQSAKITDTCTLLDTYAQKLGGAQKKIAVVGNILESTQVSNLVVILIKIKQIYQLYYYFSCIIQLLINSSFF